MGPGGQGAGGEREGAQVHGSKTNARENFLFNGLFKTPKFARGPHGARGQG